MGSPRYFIALGLPQPQQRELSRLYADRPGFAWTPPHQLHVTLRFLGEMEDTRVAPLQEALAGIRVAPFHLPLEGIGVFPPRGRPTVIWIGVGRGHPLLHQLRQRVDDTLISLGLEVDLRLFHPHVTLARIRPEAAPVSVAHFVKRHREHVGPAFHVDRFTLYASRLQPSGPVYTVRQDYPLVKER